MACVKKPKVREVNSHQSVMNTLDQSIICSLEPFHSREMFVEGGSKGGMLRRVKEPRNYYGRLRIGRIDR